MTRHADWAYAQARLQARHGGRPDNALWRALDGSRTAAHAVALTRGSSLAPWTEGLADAGDAPRIEAQLRARWRERVEAVAGWLPARWRPALRHFGTLPDLPLADAAGDADAVLARWLGDWRQRWPADAGDATLLLRPALLLLPRLGARGAARGADAAPTQHALERLFRRHAGSAVAVFAALALAALDVERLRGVLVVRALFERERERTPEAA